MQVFNYNGNLVSPDEPVIALSSRAYRYGDGFFESMKYANGRLLHAELHMARIRKSAMLLKIALPPNFDLAYMENKVQETANSKGILHARIRCTFLRESLGLYAPSNSDCAVIIEINSEETPNYNWNEHGLTLGMYKEMCKNSNYLSMLKNTSALIYVMAGIFSKENQFDDCVIFNENGRIAETVSCNIFTVSGEFVNTPPLLEYCVDGVMRRVVVNLAQAYGYTVLEQPVSEITLNTADEIFLTSATRGIRWVGTFGGKNYKPVVSKVLAEMLDKAIPT